MNDGIDSSQGQSGNTPENRPEHLWKPGVSGNPSGRPKLPVELRDLCRQYAPKAIQTAADILDGNIDGCTPGIKLRAAELLLDRGYGKPAVTVEADIHNELAIRFVNDWRSPAISPSVDAEYTALPADSSASVDDDSGAGR